MKGHDLCVHSRPPQPSTAGSRERSSWCWATAGLAIASFSTSTSASMSSVSSAPGIPPLRLQTLCACRPPPPQKSYSDTCRYAGTTFCSPLCSPPPRVYAITHTATVWCLLNSSPFVLLRSSSCWSSSVGTLEFRGVIEPVRTARPGLNYIQASATRSVCSFSCICAKLPSVAHRLTLKIATLCGAHSVDTTNKVVTFESVYEERETDEEVPVHPAASIKYDELGTCSGVAIACAL